MRAQESGTDARMAANQAQEGTTRRSPAKPVIGLHGQKGLQKGVSDSIAQRPSGGSGRHRASARRPGRKGPPSGQGRVVKEGKHLTLSTDKA